MKLAPVHFGQVIRKSVPSIEPADVLNAVAPYQQPDAVVFVQPQNKWASAITALTEKDGALAQLAVLSLEATSVLKFPTSQWMQKFQDLTGIKSVNGLADWYNGHSVDEITEVHKQLESGVDAERANLKAFAELYEVKPGTSGKPN